MRGHSAAPGDHCSFIHNPSGLVTLFEALDYKLNPPHLFDFESILLH